VKVSTPFACEALPSKLTLVSGSGEAGEKPKAAVGGSATETVCVSESLV
jgi:hypothetical protein